MPITSKNKIGEKVFSYVLDLSLAARVFTLEQVARHPELSFRAQPQKRASEALSAYRGYFDVIPGEHAKPWRWRLNAEGKRKFGHTYRSIDPMSRKIEHWLALGDLWQELTHYGGRPKTFLAEPKDSAGFDAYIVWRNKPFLVEVQRTPISAKEWRKKWERREAWYKEKGYEKAEWQASGTVIVPRPVVVLLCEQEAGTVGVPEWASVVRGLEGFTRAYGGSPVVR